MTLPDKQEIKMPKISKQKSERSVGTCLTKVLQRAKDDGRLVTGVFECASHLEQTPEKVMLCILPEVAPNQLTIVIQHKLIEAYCLENGIQVIKISSVEKLSGLLDSPVVGHKTENDNPVTSPSMDSSCVLIEWPPKVNTNKNEHRLMDHISSNQVMELPI